MSKKILYVIIAVLSGTLIAVSIIQRSDTGSSAQTTPAKKKVVYSCPMHPTVISDHPGQCPVCHMDLVKVDEEDSTGNAAMNPPPSPREKKIIFYRNPMKPDIVSAVPAKDEMGMDYLPVYEDDASTMQNSSVEGRANFSLSKERQQLIGITSTKVKTQDLTREIRASGRAAFDPELYTGIEEYRQAVAARAQMGSSSFGGLKEQADSLVESSRTKLRLSGLSDAQIRELGSGRSQSMSLLLPKGEVWVYAEVFEYEVAGLKSGLSVEVTSPAVPGQTFIGKVTSVSPVVNAPTRTVRLRALVPDPEGLLRPDTFLNVRIRIELGARLAVPENSVMYSNGQAYVFVIKEKGHFEPQLVNLGAQSQDYFEVLSGLKEGDEVVTAANFLIDSESKLRGVLQKERAVK